MATEDQLAVSQRGGGRVKMSRQVIMAMTAGATVNDGTFTPPAGTRLFTIKYHTAAAFTGTPTNIWLAIGKTAGAQDYVANVDVKGAASPTAATLVNLADYDSWPVGQAMFVSLTANGGTTPAGTCLVEIDYAPPNP